MLVQSSHYLSLTDEFCSSLPELIAHPDSQNLTGSTLIYQPPVLGTAHTLSVLPSRRRCGRAPETGRAQSRTVISR